MPPLSAVPPIDDALTGNLPVICCVSFIMKLLSESAPNRRQSDGQQNLRIK
jgi:hypothetical protein